MSDRDPRFNRFKVPVIVPTLTDLQAYLSTLQGEPVMSEYDPHAIGDELRRRGAIDLPLVPATFESEDLKGIPVPTPKPRRNRRPKPVPGMILKQIAEAADAAVDAWAASLPIVVPDLKESMTPAERRAHIAAWVKLRDTQLLHVEIDDPATPAENPATTVPPVEPFYARAEREAIERLRVESEPHWVFHFDEVDPPFKLPVPTEEQRLKYAGMSAEEVYHELMHEELVTPCHKELYLFDEDPHPVDGGGI